MSAAGSLAPRRRRPPRARARCRAGVLNGRRRLAVGAAVAESSRVPRVRAPPAAGDVSDGGPVAAPRAGRGQPL